MELKIIAALLLLLTIHKSYSAPVSGDAILYDYTSEGSQSCAVTCNRSPFLLQYQVGNTYIYGFESTTSLWNNNQIQVTGNVELSALDNSCDYTLQLRDVTFNGVGEYYLMKQQLEEYALQFGYSDGKVVTVCPSTLDKPWVINVKKAILSAIQLSARSTSSQTIVTESDINGNCETYYSPRQTNSQTIVFEKRKYLNSCANRQNVLIGLFPRSYGLNQVLNRWNNFPLLNTSYYCSQTVYNDILYKVNCVEEQYLSSTPILMSQLSLKYNRQVKGISSQRVTSFTRNKLFMSNIKKDSQHEQHKQYSVSEITELFRRIGTQIDDNIQEVPQLFTQVVYGLRYLSSSDIQRVNSNIDSASNHKVKDLWYDALALTASEGSFNVLVNAIQNNQLSEQRVNYIFTLLAFNPNPNEQSIRALVPLLESQQTLQRQVILGISSFVHNYIEQNEGQLSSQIIQRVLQALLNRLQNVRSDAQQVVVIEALSNINAFRYYPQVIQQLLDIAISTRYNDWVRVSAIYALTQSSNDNVRQQLLQQVFQQRRQSNEVRIAAYKSIVMSGPSAQQLSQIQSTINSDSNPNVANYVRSHINNLVESSDPFKQNILPANRPQFQQPIGQYFGISRNYEMSYLHESTNIGVAVEADVVYPQSQASSLAVPRYVTFNFSIPAFNKELQLVELTIRQNGLDSQFQQLFNSNFQDLSQLYNKLINMFTAARGQSNVQLMVRIDGKTIVVLDSRELNSNNWNQIVNYLRQIFERGINDAFGSVLLDSNIQLPTTNGYPLHLQLNGSVISALNAKTRLNGGALELQLSPQIAFELYNGLNLHLSHASSSSAYRFVTRLSSSPTLNLRAEKRGNRFYFKVDTPGNEQNLLDFEVNAFDNKWNQMNSKTRQMNACSKSFDTILGFAVCSDVTLPRQLSNALPIKAKIDLRKTDASMKGIEFEFETPSRDNQMLRFSFNTPNSRIDRHIMLELSNTGRLENKKQIRLQLKSPWKRFSASASLQNNNNEKSVNLEVESDSNKLASIDIGVTEQSRGQKREYRPRVRLQFSGQQQPVMLSGSVSLLKGRKNQLQINLESNDKQSNNQKNSFLRGNFIREGDSKKSNDFRLSSDITLFVPQVVELRLAGIADKSQKHALTDLNMEYKIGANKKKESIKLSAKLQNLTQTQLTKVSAFTELSSSQFPNKNFHISYNLLRKPNEHIENELTVAAGNQQNQQKLHVLQISKMMSAAQNRKSENSITFEFTPMNINYELRANAEMQRRTASDGPKYSVDVIGKDRNANSNGNNDIRASLKYAHVSRSPLKLQMDATLKIANREMAYHDELKEMSQNEYKGKTSFQWQNDKMATLDYQYKQSANGKYEIETELMTPNAIHPIKHSGMLRMTKNEFEIRSKMNAFGNQLYDMNSLYSRVGQSRASFEANGVQSRFNINPYVNPKIASLEVNGQQYYHKSNVEYTPNPISVAFKSDTKRDANSILSVDSHVSSNNPSRLIISHPYFEGSVHYDRQSPKFVLKLQNVKPNQLFGARDWTHSSTLTSNPNVKTFVSNTRISNNNAFAVDSQYRPSGKSFATITTPAVMMSVDSNLPVRQQKTVNLVVNSSPLAFEHKSTLQWNKNFAKFASNSVGSNQQLAGINYDYDSGAHSLHFASPAVNLNADLNQNNAKLSLNNNKYSHMTEVSRDGNSYALNSKTQRRSETVANINGVLSKQSESSISIATPQITTKFSANPYNTRQKSANFVFTSPTVDHITNVQYQPYESDLNLESRTRNAGQNYNLNALISRQNPSRIGLQIPAFDASVSVNKIPTPQMKFEFQGKRPSIGYNHITEVEANPAVQDKYLQVKSRTDNQINGQRLVSLDGSYSRMRGVPSQLAFKYGPNFEANLRVDPYSQIIVDGRNRNYNHNTNVQWNSNAVTVKSRTDDSGNTIAKLDSYLAKPITGDKSHVNFVTQNGVANVEYYPQKRVKVEFNRLNNPQISHKTDLQFNSIDDLSVSSQTSNAGQNVFSLNSALNRYQIRPSHMTIQSPIVSGQVFVDPSQRSGKFEMQTARINHNSQVRANNGEYVLNSNTNLDNALLANLNTRFARNSNNAISLEVPAFVAKSGLDLNERKANFDFRSKLRNGRHILSAVHINPSESDKKGFSAEIAWDKQRNPNQKLEIKMNVMKGDAKRDNMLQISANYPMIGEWELMTTANKNLMTGPHEMTIEFTPNGHPNQKTALKASHSVSRNGEFSCKANLEKANKNEFALKLWGKVSRDNTQINAESSSQTKSGYDYHLSLSTRPQGSNAHKSEIKFADNNRNEKYSLSADYSRERNNRVKGNVELEVPQYPQTKVEFDFNPDTNTVTFYAVNSLTNEQLLTFDSHLQTYPFILSANLKSNVEKIPSVNAFTKLVIDERQLISTLDVNNKRVLDVNVNLFANDDYGWNSNVRFDSQYFPKFEMSSKTVRNSKEIEYQFEGKYNENQFAVLQLHAEKNSDNGWNGKAFLSSNGKEFANLKLKHSNVATNAQKYQLSVSSQKYEAYFTPKVATFSLKNPNKNEYHYNLELCNEGAISSDSSCASADVITKFRPNLKWSPEFVEEFNVNARTNGNTFVVEYLYNSDNSYNSAYENTLLNVANQKYKTMGEKKTKMLIALNQKKFGFALNSPNRQRNSDESFDGKLMLYSPQHTLSLTADFDKQQKKNALKLETRVDEEVIFATTVTHVESYNNDEMNSEIQFSAPKLFQRNPKTVAMSLKRDKNQMNLKMNFDVSTDSNKALTILANIDNKYRNNSLHLAINSRDRRINSELKAHIGQNAISANWDHMNRNGEAIKGSLNAQRNEKQIQLSLNDDQWRVIGETDNDWFESSFWTLYEDQRQVTRVHLQSKAMNNGDHCVEMEVNNNKRDSVSRHELCAQYPSNNYFSFAVNSYNEGQKVTQFSTVLDTRSVKSLQMKLKWQPNQISDALEWITENLFANNNLFDNEFSQELQQKIQQIANHLSDDLFMPIFNLFSQIGRDFIQNFPQIKQFAQQLQQFLYTIQKNIQDLPDFQEFVDFVESYLRSIYKLFRRQCSRSDTCYQFVVTAERYGYEGVAKLFWTKVYDSAKQSHRFIMTTTGRLVQNINVPSFDEIMERTRLASLFKVLYANIQDYANSIIESNDDLKRLSLQLSQLAKEFNREFENINWDKVQQIIRNLFSVVFSRESWTSSSRVLVWNPQQGEIELEIRSPLLQSARRLKAVLSPQSHSQSGKQMTTSSPSTSVMREIKFWLSTKVLNPIKSRLI